MRITGETYPSCTNFSEYTACSLSFMHKQIQMLNKDRVISQDYQLETLNYLFQARKKFATEHKILC